MNYLLNIDGPFSWNCKSVFHGRFTLSSPYAIYHERKKNSTNFHEFPSAKCLFEEGDALGVQSLVVKIETAKMNSGDTTPQLIFNPFSVTP